MRPLSMRPGELGQTPSFSFNEQISRLGRLALFTAAAATPLLLGGCAQSIFSAPESFGEGFVSNGLFRDLSFLYSNIPGAMFSLIKTAVSTAGTAYSIAKGGRDQWRFPLMFNTLPGGLLDVYFTALADTRTPDEIKYALPVMWGISAVGSVLLGTAIGLTVRKLTHRPSSL